MKERNVKKGITSTFGSLGYLFCFLQWFWAVILYLSVIQSMTSFISPISDQQVQQSSGLTFALPDPLAMIILGVIVIIMVAITIYALISVPKSIVKTGNKIVHRTATTITPLVIEAQHKKDTKKLRIRITARVALAIKILLILLPLILAAASGLLEKQSIDYPIVLLVGGGLACFSVVFFAMQYLLAKLLHVKISDLW